MSWLSLAGIAVGLAMDAFAVSIVAGLTVAPVTARHTFRLAFHFGLFQFMMPVFGWLAGKELAPHIGHYDHWIAFSLLVLVAGKMMLDVVGKDKPGYDADPTRGILLVTLSVATSIDALAIGVSIALLSVSVWVPAIVIGLVAAGMSAVGIAFGGWLGLRWGRVAQAAGGCVLLVIAVRLFISHLAG